MYGMGVVYNGKYGINATLFKLIAITIMVIDHFAAIVLEGLLRARNQVDVSLYTPLELEVFVKMSYNIYYLNYAMRCIGRVAFPMFCFLVVEGVCHTRKPLRYLGRLGLFALISEIPFDYGFWGTLFYTDYQNVLFTLLIGATIIIMVQQLGKMSSIHSFLKVAGVIGLVFVGSVLAELGNTDYGMYGVLIIVAMYFLRGRPILQGVAAGSILLAINPIQMYSYLVVVLFGQYNGEKGLQKKYFFYLFYPLHILLLYGILQLVVKISV